MTDRLGIQCVNRNRDDVVAVDDTRLWQTMFRALATNAVSHARSHFSIGLSRHGDQVRIAVGDTDDSPPIARSPSRVGLGGLGLHLIESIATRWGHEIDPHGKVVWADIAV